MSYDGDNYSGERDKDDGDIDDGAFTGEVIAMLERRSLDIPTNPRPLPKLDAQAVETPSRGETEAQIIRLAPIDDIGVDQGRSWRPLFLAAAAIALMLGLVAVAMNQDSGTQDSNIVANVPTPKVIPSATAMPTATTVPVAPPGSVSGAPAAPRLLDRDGRELDGLSDESREYLRELVAWDWTKRGMARTATPQSVVTTIDADIQAATDDALALLPAELRASAVAIDRTSGKIVAAAGRGRSPLDRAAVGSSLHLYTLVAALESGVQQRDYINGLGPCEMETPQGAVELANFGDSVGSMDTLDAQTQRQSRCAYARLEEYVGSDRVGEVLNRLLTGAPSTTYDLGSGQWMDRSDLKLGPLDQALAVATIADRGRWREPVVVEQILDERDSPIQLDVPRDGQRLNSSVSSNAMSLLQSQVRFGTAGRADDFSGADEWVAGLTGTHPEFRAAWFTGVRGSLVIAVVVAMDDDAPMANIEGLRVTGGSLPAETWAAIQESLIDHPLTALVGDEDWASSQRVREPLSIGGPPFSPCPDLGQEPYDLDGDGEPDICAVEGTDLDDLPAPPSPPSGATAFCPSSHPNGVDEDGDGVIDVCYQETE